MKQIIHLLIFIFIGTSAFSQSFIDTTKVWNIATCSGGGVGWFCQNYSYKFSGDTLINNLLYKKLLIRQDSTNLPWSFSIAMREVGKKVYSYTNSGEVLSYDFDANIGDTIKQLSPFLNQPMIVGNIDTITFSGISRKRFFFYYNNLPQSGPYETWIEGIGSLFGVANTIVIEGILIPDYSEVTLCYWENNNLIYIDSTLNTCFIINNISEIDQNNSLQIYSNPSADIITVKFNFQVQSIANIEFFNSQGQIVKKISGEKFNQGENIKTLLISDLPPGIYFLKLYVNERLITKKFIKN
ncbi:MAG: T9SS type A sorting domain-containing protein [Nitrosopumilus sp.]|nr:T9SS type A sorting domain-containing protein [Nitrosopumilus sp.]